MRSHVSVVWMAISMILFQVATDSVLLSGQIIFGLASGGALVVFGWSIEHEIDRKDRR